MALFNQLYQIKGKHAELVRHIKNWATDAGAPCRNIDIFYISIVLGLWQNVSAKIDDTPVEPAKIDSEQMVRHNDDITYFYQLVMVTDSRYCANPKTRIEKAFRLLGTPEAEKDELHFTEVILGGLEFFYAQVMENGVTVSEVLDNMLDLVNAYYDDLEEEA